MKFKKYIYSTLFIGVMTLISACVDLNQEKPGGVSDRNYFDSEENAMKAINAAFSDLKDYRYTWTIWCMGDVLSSDATYSGSDADVSGYARMESFDFHGDNGRIGNRWTISFRGVNKANQAIHGIEGMSEDLFPDSSEKSENYKNRLLGEAYFLRAYFYHELVKAFGDVPLFTTLPTKNDKYQPRTPKEQVYEQIEKDLLFAAQNLPTKSEIGPEYTQKQAGRITQGAAYAMLGRVYLYQQKYEDSKKASLKVIESNEYQLVSDYGSQFTLEGEHGAESILEINMYDSPNQTGATNNNGNFHVLMMLPFGTTYGYGINQPTQELADAFNEIGDNIRRDASLLTEEMLQQYETPEDFSKLERNRTGYYNKKFYLPPSQRSSEIRNNPVNFRLIRLAEVYLNYAEACVKTGNDAEAHIYLKKIRDRVNLPAITGSGDELYDNIIKERRLELAMEGFRYWDGVRVGKAKEFFKAKGNFTVGKNEVLPLPQKDIDISNNAVVQNPGY